jgi:hypothetical protein
MEDLKIGVTENGFIVYVRGLRQFTNGATYVFTDAASLGNFISNWGIKTLNQQKG